MAGLEQFPQEAKLSILEKVKNKTRFFYEQQKREQEQEQADKLLADLDSI